MEAEHTRKDYRSTRQLQAGLTLLNVHDAVAVTEIGLGITARM